MAKSPAPAMPTSRQINEALETVRKFHPDARIASVGPEGVKFTYGDQRVAQGKDALDDRRQPLSWT
ncbi:hypothetical protein [Pseudooceanicola marinus]|uniref:hypothetical protein n=1 Tax=Pseudooceanicola marinus TaxID=396013 RepID=UPI001CD4A9B3|nr:hypothetical protein [Pseudooceanicola marinus]MCA1334201.1 hypothetical protein [Pseudooceanicola marinus]